MFVMHKQRIFFTVCPSCVTRFPSHIQYPPPPTVALSVLSYFLPSILIRMGHVQAGTGRRRCPSAAACQRRRSAALPTASTPWWVRHTIHLKYKLVTPEQILYVNIYCKVSRKDQKAVDQMVWASESHWFATTLLILYLASRLRGVN